MLETEIHTKPQTSEWFDDFVSHIRTDQLMLETNTADKELKGFYDSMMSGDISKIVRVNRVFSQKHLVSKIIIDYLKLLGHNLPVALAFDYNDNEVLVWAEIKDDDSAMEDHLIMAEAQINADQRKNGYTMYTTTVESRDNIAIPNHYRPLPLK